VVSTALREIEGTLIGRWYVTVLGAVFFWVAVRHLGWRRTLLYAVSAVGVGALAENASVHFGIPYTRYSFNPHLRGKELFIGDVPLMVPLSYAYMGYFAFAAGRLLASGPRRTRGRRVSHEYLLGLMLAVWALWLFDPVSRLGNLWFIGQLFHYSGPGFWFGLPLGSQVGFTLTAGLLIGLLTWLAREDEDVPVTNWRQHPHLVALTTYNAQLAWLAVVACVVGATEIGSAAILIWIPAAAMTALYWSALRAPAAGPPAAAAPAAAAPTADDTREVAP